MAPLGSNKKPAPKPVPKPPRKQTRGKQNPAVTSDTPTEHATTNTDHVEEPPAMPPPAPPPARPATPQVDPALLRPGAASAAAAATAAGIAQPAQPLLGPDVMDPREVMEQIRSMQERLLQAEARARAAEERGAPHLAASGASGSAAGASADPGSRPPRAVAPGSIPRPKGSAGGGKKGFHLQDEMGLDSSEEDNRQYNMILATVRELAHAARLDLSRPYRSVSANDLRNIFAMARKIHPYLARFENDWATAEILKQFMNSARRYGKRKGYFSCNGEASASKRRRFEDEDEDDSTAE